ncbi:hypothetical protein PoB_001021700 [Plakobranchus ocellatus]|uniref:Uncharacterized protein n=1 Tax=Plakobranchus ocellatus TaxID=259542 RepID=A0AAV3YMS9_9GAST|nr:hypothetical protein PoB_001021700 [Plakobranchus ocellatus]
MSVAKRLKLCVIGDVGVGKTSLAERFMTGMFREKYTPTYQANHYHKHIQTPDGEVYIQIWDTSGTERFRSVGPHLLHNSHGAVLTYDVTCMPTFSSIEQYWLEWVRNIAPEDFRLILVGNKVDRTISRQVDEQVARRFSREHGLLYYETSAKSGENVELAFLEGVSLLGDVWEDSGILDDSVDLYKPKTVTGCIIRGCCLF